MRLELTLFLAAALLLSACEGPPRTEPDHSRHDHTNASVTDRTVPFTESSKGAAAAPADLQLIDTVGEMRRVVIEMLLLVNTRSQDPEIRKFASARLESMRREKANFDELRSKRFPSANTAINIELAGVSRFTAAVDSQRLASLKSSGFDREFLTQSEAADIALIELVDGLGASGDTGLADLLRQAVEMRTAHIQAAKRLRAEPAVN